MRHSRHISAENNPLCSYDVVLHITNAYFVRIFFYKHKSRLSRYTYALLHDDVTMYIQRRKRGFHWKRLNMEVFLICLGLVDFAEYDDALNSVTKTYIKKIETF